MPDAELRADLDEQFASLAHQREVATLGIWLFLATEVLFFGGMLASYLVYRVSYPDGFAEAGRHTKIVLGTINTAVLLTSSLFMALAVRAAKLGLRRSVVLWLALTALLGVAFIGIKGFEYSKEWEEHLVPALNFAFPGEHRGPVEIFYLLYFIMTGIHALHLTVGVCLVVIMMALAWRGWFRPEWYTPIEVTGLYWHFVDIVWIFLYPLIYLVGRS